MQQNLKFLETNETNVQKLACDMSSSVFLFANAGTGKTKTLCDRFIGHILFGSEPTKILCLTYTNAAAEEMKERILSLAYKWSKLSDEELRNELLSRYEIQVDQKLLQIAKSIHIKMISSFADLKIQTLHAFCNSLLQRFREYNPSERQFEIADSSKIKKIRSLTIDESISNYDSSKIIDISKYYTLGEIKEKLQSLLAKSADLKRFFESFDCSNLSAIYSKLFDIGLNEDVNLLEKEILKIDDSYSQHIKDTHPKIYQLLLNSKTVNERIEIYFTKEGEVRKNLDKLDDKIINNEIFRLEFLLQKIKKAVSLKINLFFLDLVKIAHAQIESQKQKMQIYEFDDLLFQTHKLLSSGENAQNLLYKLDYEIDQILVDEAQDLSSHQWEIINLLSDEFFSGDGSRAINRNIFVVGDFKQSIYSFQGAEPSIFLKMSELYSKKCLQINRSFKKLDMIKSYRTTKTVLDLVDKIFEGDRLITSNHIAVREGQGVASVYPLIENVKEKTGGWVLPKKDGEELESKSVLAKKIAAEIKEWITTKRIIRGKERPIEPRDIYILFRKRSELMTLIGKELKKRGINVDSQVKINLSETLLFWDFRSLLLFVIHPIDDLNLAGLLKSPFFNLTDKQLSEICLGEEVSLIEKIKQRDPFLYRSLDFYIRLYQEKSVAEFFEIVARKNYENFLKRFGQVAENVIEALLFKIKLSAEEGINYLELLSEFDSYDAEIDVKNESANAVSLMTMHSSKGLQAPVIIIADSSASANIPADDIIWFKNVPIIVSPKKFNDGFTESLKEINKKKQIEESDRLLYVALTRAEDELHVFGAENKTQNKSWYSKIELFAEKKDFIDSQDEIRLQNKESYRLFKYRHLDSEIKYKFSSHIEFSSKEILKGELCHYLLELMSYGVPKKSALEHAYSYSDKLDEVEAKDCCVKVFSVYDKYPWLFCRSSFSEVGFQKSNGQEIRIDKIVFEDAEIKVIDFKSDKIIPKNISQIRPDYIKQLKEYSSVVERVYGKKVKTAIIWLEDSSILEF